MLQRAILLSFLLALFVPASLGCDDDPVRVEPRPEGEVSGVWSWLSTFNPWTGETTTPADAGYSEQLRLEADGSFALLRRGIVQWEGTYTVDWNADPPVVIVDAVDYELRGDDLIHDSTPVDGPRVIYRWRGPL